MPTPNRHDVNEGEWTLVRAADGTEAEAYGWQNARTAAFALFQDGAQRPIDILPGGNKPLGSYGRIG